MQLHKEGSRVLEVTAEEWGQMQVLLLPLWNVRGCFFTGKEHPSRLQLSFSLRGGGPELPFPGLYCLIPHSLSEQMTPAVKRVPGLLQAMWVL